MTLKEMQGVLGIAPKAVIPYQPKLFAGAAARASIPAAKRGPFTDGVAALAFEIYGRSVQRRAWWRFGR